MYHKDPLTEVLVQLGKAIIAALVILVIGSLIFGQIWAPLLLAAAAFIFVLAVHDYCF